MTTSHSPLRVLKHQADTVAKTLKAIDRGETVATDSGGKIAASREKGEVTFGVVMDDKVLKVTMQWSTIRAASEAAISEFILDYMRGARETAH